MTTTINASNSGSGGLIQTADASGILALQTAGTTAVTVDTSQRVGIGTTSPGANLEVAGASGQNIYVSYNSGSQLRLKSDSGDSGVGTTGATPLLFLVNNGEKARIDTSGNVLVGTTSVIQSGKLSVSGVISSQNSGAGYSANQTNSTGDQFYFRTSSGANLAGYITCPTSTTTQYLSISDYRLKNNVAPMSGALDLVLQLKPVTYTWKADGAKGQGFIAHELQAVVPDCVGGDKDAVDANGNPQYQGIDTSFLVATLTAAIQEQQALITSLTARIAALEGTP